MIGFLSLFKDNQNYVSKKQIRFVHIPDDLPPEEIKKRCAKVAQEFANSVDSNRVYLNYGKDDEYIEYEYTI